jgi:hypothetical protein
LYGHGTVWQAFLAVWLGGAGRFDDLTGTVLAGHHQPLRVWVLCLYFMGLNLSNRQIALELGLDGSDTQAMTEHLRRGLVAKTPAVELTGEVEIDEVYVVAGHKGQPAADRYRLRQTHQEFIRFLNTVEN